MTDSLIIIPTYNEKENIEKIIRKVFSLEKIFHVLIVDDMIGTAGTILNAAKVAKEKGALSVTVAATHGILSGEAIERLLSLTNTLVLAATVFAILIAFAAFILIINTLRLTAFAKRKEIKVMKLIGASSTYIRLPFMFEAIFESLLGTSIAVGLGWGLIQYSKDSVVAESIFDITISDTYLINLTLGLILTSIIFGFFASYVGIRKALNE